ncbi:MAG: molecular chaperone HtpG, partial [Mucinivorans sp.]
FHIHLNVDYPFNLTGILYFPRLKNNFEVQKNKIQLYCNQVYVTDSVEGIVPEFLTLLHGVLDSPDIPLNVSRSYLQSDSNVKKISTHITKKVADRLADIFKNQRADYEMNWDELKLFIQYGVVSNEKFGDRASEFALLKNTTGQYFALDDYAASIKENQTDKNGKIVHLYTADAVAQDSFIQAAKAKGYDVLVMDSPLESHWIGFLEHKHSDWTFVRVDSAPIDTLIAKDKEESMALSEDQQKEIETTFQGVMPTDEDKVKYTVKVSALQPDSAPMVITQDEFMRRMKDMSKVGGGGMSFYGEIPDSYSVVVNGNHPLIVDLLSQESDRRLATAKKLVELSLLQAGLLRGEALTQFITRSIEGL